MVDDMRKFIEKFLPDFYSNYVTSNKTVVTSELFMPNEYMTKDFFDKMKTVLSARKNLYLRKWENFFAINSLKALSSHEMYLKYVFFACIYVSVLSDNAFDAIIRVCAQIINFNNETLMNCGVNFCELTSDIFMVYYESHLKESFVRDGGFKQFVKYIRREYLKLTYCFDYSIISKCVSNTENTHSTMEELKKVPNPPEFFTDVVIKGSLYQTLAQKVISCITIKLPVLPSPANLEIRFRTAREKKAEIFEKEIGRSIETLKRKRIDADLKRKEIDAYFKREEIDAYFKREEIDVDMKRETMAGSTKPEAIALNQQKKLGSVFDFESFTKVIEQVNNLIESIVMQNHLKSNASASANNRIQNEVEKVCKSFKSKIVSLIEILDEYNEE